MIKSNLGDSAKLEKISFHFVCSPRLPWLTSQWRECWMQSVRNGQFNVWQKNYQVGIITSSAPHLISRHLASNRNFLEETLTVWTISTTLLSEHSHNPAGRMSIGKLHCLVPSSVTGEDKVDPMNEQGLKTSSCECACWSVTWLSDRVTEWLSDELP